MSVRLLIGDCRDKLRELPDASVHCCVTSPPYFSLRDYGCEGQMGLEASPDEYVAALVGVFNEVHRLLRDDGTLWLNLGDSYAGSWGAQSRGSETPGTLEGGSMLSARQIEAHPKGTRTGSLKNTPGIKAKDLIGIPWRVAFALQAAGWYLRQDIIWSKPNPMPESVRDRCTKAHEYIFLLSKGPRYHYDQEAIFEPTLSLDPEHPSFRPNSVAIAENGRKEFSNKHVMSARSYNPLGRNKRSVWEVATQPFSEAHFATFPPALIEPCILAGCPDKCCAKCGAPWVREVELDDPVGRKDPGGVVGMADAGMYTGRAGSRSARTVGFTPSCGCCHSHAIPGTVLDPFGGAGTTGLVADRLGRNAILIELNPEYAEIAERRLNADGGMFAEVMAA